MDGKTPAGTFITFLAERQDVLFMRTSEHLMLAGAATLIATVVGVILGIAAFRYPRIRGLLLGGVGVLQTIPSLALLVFLMALFHRIGLLPALTALSLYALLPIVRNTVTGLESVDASVMEAARGIGMTPAQQLMLVRIPLATPVIIAGVRTAAVVSVGFATLAAFIGAGGLGEFINRGLALSNNNLILLGAVPAALLALSVDFVLAGVEWGLKPVSSRSRIKSRPLQKGLKLASFAIPLVMLVAGTGAYLTVHPLVSSYGTVAVGTKHFSEHILLGELIAQTIEAKTDLRVARRFDFPGTMFCHGALLSGDLDIYPEYTGTALCAVLDKEIRDTPASVFSLVKKDYAEKFDLTWLPPFGFNNTWVLVVRRDDARRNGWSKVSDLKEAAGGLNLGVSAEFAERPDGLSGLKKAYGLRFGSVSDMDPNLVYRAVKNKEMDVACANSTDGRIEAFNLVALEDDLGFFPPYEAAPIVRAETLARYPELKATLESLSGILDDDRMRQLNFQVDGLKRSPRAVIRDFLEEEGIVGNSKTAA
ncbi:MAG: glycine betaine ABC transporter substrate-binding protein [Candidatus Obscuribacterales bacterium]